MGYSRRVEPKFHTAVELFAGIGGFRLAADRCGLRTVWANDVSALATDVYRNRFGQTSLVEGDLRAHLRSIPPHDLLTAGFPCQPFSFAGKKLGIGDARGSLFRTILDVLDRLEPRAFVLENVSTLLSSRDGTCFGEMLRRLARGTYHLTWRVLDAADFGLPQIRRRLFVVGIRPSGSEGPARRESALRTTSSSISGHRGTWPAAGRAFAGEYEVLRETADVSVAPRRTLRDVLEPVVDPSFDFTETTLARIGTSKAVNRHIRGVQVLFNQEGGRRMGYTVYGVDGLAPTVTATTSRHYERFLVNDRFRRLTPVEYARVQGFPDHHCDVVAPHHRYILLGNAVPPPMATWVIRSVLAGNPLGCSSETRAD
jgi:DNA (cytosine-5)-methyltransferase 1